MADAEREYYEKELAKRDEEIDRLRAIVAAMAQQFAAVTLGTNATSHRKDSHNSSMPPPVMATINLPPKVSVNPTVRSPAVRKVTKGVV